jgi:hypothetical protein
MQSDICVLLSDLINRVFEYHVQNRSKSLFNI